jgi:glycerol kinase
MSVDRVSDLAQAARHKLASHDSAAWSDYLWEIHDHYLSMMPGPMAIC